VAYREDASPILNGIPSHLPDIDPAETQEWLESLDAVIDGPGRTRARYLMLRLLERAREMQVGVPSLTTTDYINTIDPEHEPWYPGDEAAERRFRAYLRWNAAMIVHRAQRPGIGVGGHISSYASAATLYEVGMNHFFRGKDHPGGGDHVFFQGHASPGTVRPRLPRGPDQQRAPRRLPPGAQPRRRRQAAGAAVLPAPAPDVGLLGVPDGLDGHRADERDLPGAVRQVPPQPGHQGHQPAAHLGLPR
jgi:Pyruvate dehydrogenase complex, dehydrogenase (E1) component